MRRKRRIGCLLPQSYSDSRSLACGAASALGNRCAACAFGDEPGEPGAAIVARAAGEAAVDHNPYVFEGVGPSFHAGAIANSALPCGLIAM